MDDLNKENIYQASMFLIRRDGIRFTVDDLSSQLHIAKKTIYTYFSCKEELAKWIYQESFSKFQKKLEETKVLLKEGNLLLFPLFMSYSDLISLNEERTFNRYSLTSTLKKYSIHHLKISRSLLKNFLISTPLKKDLDNISFIPSLEASLSYFNKQENRAILIEEYCSLIEGI